MLQIFKSALARPDQVDRRRSFSKQHSLSSVYYLEYRSFVKTVFFAKALGDRRLAFPGHNYACQF